jgi:hypothetical protein
VKQNVIAVAILLGTIAALWIFWPRPPGSATLGGGATATTTATALRFEGNLELVTGERIVGWAFDRTRPDDPVQVEIFDGVNAPVTITADTLRPDLQTVGKGNGKHAFIFKPGNWLAAGKTYTIHAKIVGAPAELQHSPQQLIMNGTAAPATGENR